MRFFRFAVALSCGLIFSRSLSAQTPTISQVTPWGLPPGKTVNVKLNGGNLAGATQLWTSFGGTAELAADVKENGKNAGEVTFKVTVPPAEQCQGIQGLRVVTGGGVSDLKMIAVDPLPVIAHNNQNKSPGTAQEITAPCAVEGHVDKLTRIYFRFAVAKGQRLSFEVQARRLGSPLDPVIRLFNPQGREVAWSDDEPGLQGDAQFTRTFEDAGDYTLELSDIRYQGGGGHRFRLRIGDFGLINTPYPMVVQAGQPTEVQFAGVNADQLVNHPTVTIPDSDELAREPLVWRTVVPPVVNAAPDAYEAGSALVGVSRSPQFLETEPNDAADKANRVELGHGINGRFEKPNDVDRFVFAAKKGQKFRFDAVTRQAGSPVDLSLELLKPDGGRLTQAEDVGLEDAGFDFNCPADGDYTLVARDLHRRGGPEFAYHVSVTDNKPRFELTATANTLNVSAGGVLAVQVNAQRKGYGGTIKVEARNLGEGLTSQPTFIGAGRNDAILTIFASKEAATGILSVGEIVGSAEIGGATYEAAASMQDVVKNTNNALPWPSRNLIYSTAAAVAPALPVSLRFEPAEVVLGPNLSAKVKVIAERSEGWEADIALANNPAKNGLPGGIAFAPQPIKAKTNEIELTLTATDKAGLGEFTAVLTGTIKKDKATKTVSTPGLTFKLQAPLSVAVDPAGGKVAKGGELKLKVSVTRNPALSAPVTVTAANLPKGVSAEAVTIAADQSEGEITLKAAADAEAGSVDNLQIKADAALGDKKKFSVNSANLKLTVE